MKFTPQAGDETGASGPRRIAEGYNQRYFNERRVLDIGCGNHPIVPWADTWDIALGDGDAKTVVAPDGLFATVYASHVLEHMSDPHDALHEWWRLVAPGGHLIVAVPDEDLYEQGVWPSLFNSDHRYSWTALKGPQTSTGPESLQLADILKTLPCGKLLSLRVCDDRYDYSAGFKDQAGTERQVEAIMWKTPDDTEWKSSIARGFACMCGSTEHLRLRGLSKEDKLMLECRLCGQRSTVNMTVKE